MEFESTGVSEGLCIVAITGFAGEMFVLDFFVLPSTVLLNSET